MAQDLKIPPHSAEAEESVIGALLMDKDAVVAVASILMPEYFYEASHQRIYSAILSLYEEREPIDLITVSQKLKSAKLLSKVGGRTYLTDLMERVPTSAHAETYAKIVKDLAVKRDLISSASRVVQMAFDESIETRQVLDKAEQAIFSLSQRHLTRNFIPLKDALSESFDRLDELQKNASGLRGVATGFSELDFALAGMQNSNLLILAGRPGLGKTALALNFAQFAAVREKVPVGFFSLEMSKEELVDRLLVSQAEIDSWRLKTGKLSDDDFSRLSDAMGVLAEAPLFIDDSPGISVMEMRTKARRLQVEQGCRLLVVDYLQLAAPGRRYDSRVQEVSEISQSLKNLARELKIPVLALSQLSRAVEARGTKIPQLADLRESGAIEQDADVVMFLYREDDENMENVTLSIAKHRNGPLKQIKLRFRGDRIRFYPSETKRKG